MSIQKQFLAVFIKSVTSGDFFKKALQLVSDIDGSGLSGREKHDKVLADLKDIGGDIATPLINLAIEIAVIFLKKLI
jgi:hypothetical protein